MADYILSPADIKPVTTDNVKPLIQRLTAGEAIVAGKSVAVHTVTGNAVLFDAVDGTKNTAVGIAVNDAVLGQPLSVQQAGYVTVSAVGVAGDVVVGSQTAGGLAPVEDLVAGDEVVIVGYFTDSSTILVDIINLGIQKG